MRVVRAGLPALVGTLFLLFGLQSVAGGLQSGDPGSLAPGLQVGVFPLAIGITLLLAAAGAMRRTRFGYLLGLGVGLLMAVAGLAAIVAEIPFLQQGGLGGAIGGGVVVLAAVWTLVWLVYTWRFTKSKDDFATAWTSADRRLAVVVALVIALAASTFVGIGALQTNAAQRWIDSDGAARMVVEATGFEVRAVDRTLAASGTAGGQIVDRLKIEIVLRSDQPYALAVPPTLCLTSLAAFSDPAYKPGLLCWGIPGPEASLLQTKVAQGIPRDTTAVTIELRGTGSPCPFPPGQWNAELILVPSMALADGGTGPAPGRYSIDSTFFVDPGDVAPPPSAAPAASDGCMGVSP